MQRDAFFTGLQRMAIECGDGTLDGHYGSRIGNAGKRQGISRGKPQVRAVVPVCSSMRAAASFSVSKIDIPRPKGRAGRKKLPAGI